MSVEDTLIGFSKKVVGVVWYGGAEVPLKFVRKDGQCSVWNGGSFVFFRTRPSDFSKQVLMRYHYSNSGYFTIDKWCEITWVDSRYQLALL